MSGRVVIVGAGHAGVGLAAALRERGHDGSIHLVSDEACLPYHRPPLSKAYFADGFDPDSTALRSGGFYDKNDITLVPRAALQIDRRHRRVMLAGGQQLGYERLILATGARNRTLAGAALPNVMTLRNRSDAEAIRAALPTARHIVVIGGGFVGVELAAALAPRAEVTLVCGTYRLLPRAISPLLAGLLADALCDLGVRLRFGKRPTGFDMARGIARAALFDDGDTLSADLFLVGIGADPDVRLARQAGLAVGMGIRVDPALTASDSLVSAIGDCAEVVHPDGTISRLESVFNAVDQANRLADRMTARPMAPPATPWFWSDVGPHRLRIVGQATPADVAVAAARSGAPGSAMLYFRNDRLVAVETLDRIPTHQAARRLLASDPPAMADLRRHGFDLVALAQARSAVPA